MIWAIVSMVGLMAFISLAVDLGRVQLAKTELQRAADAAARYAATGLSISPATARARAKAAASDNTVDGVSLTLVDSDIDLGTWNSSTKTFTVLSGSAESSATAFRVNAARNAAKGNAIPLMFAKVLGLSSCSISATAITTANAPDYSVAYAGFSGVDVKNNIYFGSYNSNSTTTPSQATANANVSVSSNGSVTGGSATVNGNLILGPSATSSGFTVNGNTLNLSSNISTPPSPTWSPGINPGSVPQTYTVSGSTTLAGGTYWFTSLTVSGTLQFSSPATVYVNGDVDLSGAIMPTSLVPSDLQINQIGTHTFGNVDANNVNIVAVISAPNSALSAKNNLEFRGRGIFDTITVKNNAEFFYDETLGNAMGTSSVSTVK